MTITFENYASKYTKKFWICPLLPGLTLCRNGLSFYSVWLSWLFWEIRIML